VGKGARELFRATGRTTSLAREETVAVKPTLVSIWLVDEVNYDEETARSTLRGLFNGIVVPLGASEHTTPFTVFFSVTDVRSRCACQLRLSDLSNLEVIYTRPVILEQVAPSEVLDVTVRVNSIPVPGPGEYAWDLFHGADILGGTRMTIEVAG
jgi:hypothetical protein